MGLKIINEIHFAQKANFFKDCTVRYFFLNQKTIESGHGLLSNGFARIIELSYLYVKSVMLCYVIFQCSGVPLSTVGLQGA